MNVYDEAVQQMTDNGVIEYRTMRKLLGLPDVGWSVAWHNICLTWQAFTAALQRIIDGPNTQQHYILAGGDDE